MGRPRVITKDVVGKLREAFLMGCTDREACAYARINKDTLYEFQKRHPEFSDQKESWKLNPILKAKATVYNTLNETKVAMWFLERKCREEFSLRHEIVQPSNEITMLLDELETDYEQLAKDAQKELEKTQTSPMTQN